LEINSIFTIAANDKDSRPEFSRVLVHLTQTPHPHIVHPWHARLRTRMLLPKQ